MSVTNLEYNYIWIYINSAHEIIKSHAILISTNSMISLEFRAGKFEFGSGVAMPNGKIFGNKTSIKTLKYSKRGRS